MTACLSERELVELATGDGDATMRAHAAACAGCTARLGALERDLSLLRVALREAPAGARVRRPWLPFAAATATAVAAALLLFTLTPLRPAAPVVASTEPTTEFGDALANALFADASLDTTDVASDDRDVAAALNGGALCDDGYGDDCADVLLAGYED